MLRGRLLRGLTRARHASAHGCSLHTLPGRHHPQLLKGRNLGKPGFILRQLCPQSPGAAPRCLSKRFTQPWLRKRLPLWTGTPKPAPSAAGEAVRNARGRALSQGGCACIRQRKPSEAAPAPKSCTIHTSCPSQTKHAFFSQSVKSLPPVPPSAGKHNAV